MLEFENKNPDWKKYGKEAPVTTEKDLTAEQTQQIKDSTDSANTYLAEANKKLIKDPVDKYRDYAQQRTDIEAKFSAGLAAMYDASGNLAEGATRANVDELKRQ